MVNEFHPLTGDCAVVVPSGPGYEGVNVANQVCTTVGSLPGQTTVSGARYIQLSFEYSFSHMWRVSLITSEPAAIYVSRFPLEFRHRHCIWPSLHFHLSFPHGVQYRCFGRVIRYALQAWLQGRGYTGG